MSLLELFWGFLKVGCFSFGGAYAAIPIIRDIVRSYGWLTDEALEHMIAVSESTPGPIMVNLATYVGADRGGLPGAALATFAVVLPAFLIIVLLLAVFKNAEKNRFVQALLAGLKPCVTGVILAVGAYMILCNIMPGENGGFEAAGFDLKALVITLILGAAAILWRKLKKKRLSPILLIVIAAGLGMIAYGV
ncbi:MAG: chromate transporter [Clostridia bacterium]|nr:chromate transporter [Clostridia bacterium]